MEIEKVFSEIAMSFGRRNEQSQAQAFGQLLKSKSQTYQGCMEILLILLKSQGLDFKSWKLEMNLSLGELE